MNNKLYRRTDYRNTRKGQTPPSQEYVCPHCHNTQGTFIAHIRKEIDEHATDEFSLAGGHSGFVLEEVRTLRYQLDYILCPSCERKITGSISDPLRRMVFAVYSAGR